MAAVWVSSAPLRVSLAGGGTDVPSYAGRFGGTVLGGTLDLRVTVAGRRGRTGVRACLDSCGRVVTAAELANPFAAAALAEHGDGSPVELASFGDVPGGSGLGSSAAFCLALLAGLRGAGADPRELAELAAGLEMTSLGRPVGRQDHYLSALGGLRLLHFTRAGTVEVEEVATAPGFADRLGADLLLFFTGTVRDAGSVLGAQDAGVARGDRAVEDRLHEIKELAAVAVKALADGDSRAVGEVLARHWELKRGLGPGVSLPVVDRAYRQARAAGATGGKLMGAGGGGFLLLHAEAPVRAEVRAAVTACGLVEYDFAFDTRGVVRTDH